MQTTLFQIKFKDGRTFKIFCANRHQINRFKITISELSTKNKSFEITELANGIHNINQWQQIVNKI